MRYWGMPYYNDGYGFGGVGIFGVAITVLFCLMLFFLFMSLMRGFRMHGRGGDFEGGNSGRAMNILKERYAKGEITKKEFDEMKKDIS